MTGVGRSSGTHDFCTSSRLTLFLTSYSDYPWFVVVPSLVSLLCLFSDFCYPTPTPVVDFLFSVASSIDPATQRTGGFVSIV